MFSETEYALNDSATGARTHRGSSGGKPGTSSNMIKVLEHWARQDDPVIDELSYEAGLYDLRIQRESVYIRGELVAPRRVFVSVPGFESYEHVGWIVRIDCKSCMVCAKPFAKESDKINCTACGNVICKVRCGGNVGVVDELPPSAGSVVVCVQCFWGQEPVHAVLHEDEVIAPYIVRRTRSSTSAYGNQGPIVPFSKLSTGSSRPSTAATSKPGPPSSAAGDHVEGTEAAAPQAVTPKPRFVLLTKTHAGRSIYINVLEHDAIAPGTYVAGPNPKEILSNTASSASDTAIPRGSDDNLTAADGESCLVFDVSCNASELSQALSSEIKDNLKCVSILISNMNML